ncbi:hypothetical protein C8J56DRAFT_810142, partial [Mycena floridula]
PTLSDLHPSLVNREHLWSYITQVQDKMFPHGTDWAGMNFPLSCLISNIHSIPRWTNKNFHMIICMKPAASCRLSKAQYLQSDIGFKPISRFEEFEIGHLDLGSHTAMVYCQVYLNRQSAQAHLEVFHTIDSLVLCDMGQHLKWRHLCASSLNDFVGILQWAGDQHGGQAKGLGLFLVEVACKLFPGCYDLHEPYRLVAELDEYDHLRRLFCLCVVHILRNIRKSTVSDSVKNLMHSLICIEHPDWSGTINFIDREGGKAGHVTHWSLADWVEDKLRSKFAFEGMCWTKSFILKPIWMAGDDTSNIIEMSHSDVNREGLHCTLVGGLGKG